SAATWCWSPSASSSAASCSPWRSPSASAAVISPATSWSAGGSASGSPRTARPSATSDGPADREISGSERGSGVSRWLVPLGLARLVLSDRYADATVAYQGHGRGIDPDLIRELNVRATGGVLPDLTLLFDLDPAEGFRRIGGRRRDHFEREALAFHRRVRRGYLEILRAEPKRMRLVRAAEPPDVVAAAVRTIVEE